MVPGINEIIQPPKTIADETESFAFRKFIPQPFPPSHSMKNAWQVEKRELVVLRESHRENSKKKY